MANASHVMVADERTICFLSVGAKSRFRSSLSFVALPRMPNSLSKSWLMYRKNSAAEL